jgi:hypothetical protein
MHIARLRRALADRKSNSLIRTERGSRYAWGVPHGSHLFHRAQMRTTASSSSAAPSADVDLRTVDATVSRIREVFPQRALPNPIRGVICDY